MSIGNGLLPSCKTTPFASRLASRLRLGIFLFPAMMGWIFSRRGCDVDSVRAMLCGAAAGLVRSGPLRSPVGLAFLAEFGYWTMCSLLSSLGYGWNRPWSIEDGSAQHGRKRGMFRCCACSSSQSQSSRVAVKVCQGQGQVPCLVSFPEIQA